MKLTNNRFYLDFNATSPLAPSVKDWLAKGDFLFGNPSSIHHSGKRSKRFINETKDYLYQYFGLQEDDFFIVFHSGASEAINSFNKGFFKSLSKKEKKGSYFYAPSDHSCVRAISNDLECEGHSVETLTLKKCGLIDLELSERTVREGNVDRLVSFTWVNNESGVINSLDGAIELKRKTGAIIHVDAVQSVGKIKNFQTLSPEIDIYTFSGHKFGSLKGVGFSFVKKSLSIEPYVKGGGQQEGLRSGTQNTDGIYSLKLALEYLTDYYDFSENEKAKNKLKAGIVDVLGDKGVVVAADCDSLNSNTICFVISGVRADVLMMAFDIAGFEVSSGSACASGSVNPSPVLLAMGFSDEEARCALRLSISPYWSSIDVLELMPNFLKVLKRFV